MEAYKDLKKVDDQLIETSQRLIRHIVLSAGIGKTQREAVYNISIAGSGSEGAIIARLFKGSKNVSNELNREIEVDLEFNLMEVPIRKRNIIQDIPGKEGFVSILYDEEILRFSESVGWSTEGDLFKECLNEQGFFQTYRIKKQALTKVQFRNEDKYIELLLAAALDVDFDSISLSHPHQGITKSSVDNNIKVHVDGELKVEISWDLVFVFNIMWWPSIAQEWKDRERNWPCIDTIEELTKVGCIITKPSDSDKDNEESVEMRYSFAHIERELVSRRSSHQNFIYFLFKSMIYKWIKPLNPDQIHSFHGKTIMFWVCERYPPDDSFWNEDEKAIYDTLQYLFTELKSAFQKGFLSYYFIKQINIIENIDPQLAIEIINQITLIEADVSSFLPSNVNEVRALAEEMLALAQSTITMMKHVEEKDVKFFLRERPRLCAKAFEVFRPKIEEKIRKEVENTVQSVNEEGARFERRTRQNVKNLEKSIRKIFK